MRSYKTHTTFMLLSFIWVVVTDNFRFQDENRWSTSWSLVFMVWNGNGCFMFFPLQFLTKRVWQRTFRVNNIWPLCQKMNTGAKGNYILKLEIIWFFVVKSWFFTRNTPKKNEKTPNKSKVVTFFSKYIDVLILFLFISCKCERVTNMKGDIVHIDLEIMIY